jgi:hypothetical protein
MRRSNPKLKAKIIFKLKSFIAMLPYHILVMSSVAIFSFIFNKFIEAILFLVAFFALRYKFPMTFHAKSIVYCMVITNAMFAASIVLCPIIHTYVFGALFFAYLDAFILWYIQTKEHLRQEKECAELVVEELRAQIKELQNPTDEFIDKCRKAKLSKRDTEIAIKCFIEKLTPKEIWLWLCDSKEYETIEWDSVYKLIVRIGNKLNMKR